MDRISYRSFIETLIAACLVMAVTLSPAGQATAVGALAPVQIEIDALVALYNATGGPNWTHHEGWLVDPDPCNWYGVTCGSHTYPSYHVIWLHLANNNLTGQLPPEIVNLTQLDELLLNDNHLSGHLPAGMDNFDYLVNLLLNNNQISGPIPPDIGGISIGPLGQRLVRLYLQNNLLEGAIPPELGDISNLFYLNLSGNRLIGQVPEELGNLTLLRELNLSSNRLHGNLPESLGNLSMLQSIDVSNNYLGGEFPLWLTDKAYLEEIRLNNNYFTGPIPDEISSSTNLQVLWLGNNYFTGNLPTSLGTLSDLISIWVANNPMSGVLPETLTYLNLYSFWYNNTGLCEPLTPTFLSWLATIHDLQRNITCKEIVTFSTRSGSGGSYFHFTGHSFPPNTFYRLILNGQETNHYFLIDEYGLLDMEIFVDVPPDYHGMYYLVLVPADGKATGTAAGSPGCGRLKTAETTPIQDYIIISPDAPYLPSSGTLPVIRVTEEEGLDQWLYLPMVRRQLPLTIILGGTTTENNLALMEGGDYDTALITTGAGTARRTGNGQALPASDGNQVGDYYLQINAADASIVAGSPTQKVQIEVEYLDQGNDMFNIQYDAQSGGPFGDGRFKDTAVVTKTNSGQWRTAVFLIDDAYFANRDHGGDFRIFDFGDGYEIIRKVTVNLIE